MCGAGRPRRSPVSPPRLPCHARHDGFDLPAGVLVPAKDRARLERVCRYALRPPLAADRVRRAGDSEVISSCVTAARTAPLTCGSIPSNRSELAGLTPKPRINVVPQYGVLRAHAV